MISTGADVTPNSTPWGQRLLSLAGLLLMAAAIYYGIYKFNAINSKIALKEAQLSELAERIAPLKQEIEFIRTAPLQELITPKAIAILLPGRFDQRGRQLYNFLLWLELPFARKADIKTVKYQFDHSSMIGKLRESSESSNGFLVGKLIWGALPSVPITVALHQGAPFTIDFRMAEETKFMDLSDKR